MRNVLFLCTGNSARSILAEALLNANANGRYRGFSAGSRPAGRVNPFALALLGERGIATTGLRSKSWEEFAAPGAPDLHYVLTVCDSAAGEACPYWPGHPATAHWGIPDPTAVEGDDDEKRRAFDAAYERLSARIGAFLRVPLETLAPDVAAERLREIGRLP